MYTPANSRLLMSARFFSLVSLTKNGRLWAVHFREVDTWLLEVHFYALSVAYRYFLHFESDRSTP